MAPDGSGGVDAARVTKACERASRVADSYLAAAGRYVVPIPAPGEDLRGAVADLARTDLYDNREPEAIAKRRDRAVAWLRDVAAGRAVLFDADSNTTQAPRGIAVATSEAVFTDDFFRRVGAV